LAILLEAPNGLEVRSPTAGPAEGPAFLAGLPERGEIGLTRTDGGPVEEEEDGLTERECYRFHRFPLDRGSAFIDVRRRWIHDGGMGAAGLGWFGLREAARPATTQKDASWKRLERVPRSRTKYRIWPKKVLLREMGKPTNWVA